MRIITAPAGVSRATRDVSSAVERSTSPVVVKVFVTPAKVVSRVLISQRARLLISSTPSTPSPTASIEAASSASTS